MQFNTYLIKSVSSRLLNSGVSRIKSKIIVPRLLKGIGIPNKKLKVGVKSIYGTNYSN